MWVDPHHPRHANGWSALLHRSHGRQSMALATGRIWPPSRSGSPPTFIGEVAALRKTRLVPENLCDLARMLADS
jgi:hypothetical protein